MCIFLQTPISDARTYAHHAVLQGPTQYVTTFFDSSLSLLIYLQTATALTWFVLSMIAYPDKQRKCQEELDAIVGRSRMPTFADWDNLPYVHATVKEVLRWRPVVPVGEC